MNLARGIMMLLASGIAFYKAWQVHGGETALFACALGVLALGLGLWHLTHRAAPRRG